MDAFEAIITRRSVREYTDRPVARETVEKLLAAAMQAPFSGREQPWHFVVIDDPEILSRIPAVSPYAEVRPPAPAAILVCLDLRIPESPDLRVQGCAAATENLLLAAHALGLGAVWTAVYPDPDLMLGFANLFSLPDGVAGFALVTVGYPAARPPPVDRYREERVHHNGW
ncbi:nitroreductase family protein [Methanoculleus sp. CWC-02]|uniref:Nitroreductase family protein n=2 Tax=Methanoculleus oceani TaxID=2184756 RepID=A0ABD4THX1_9EURY|nr:nitroreductase family protein [Methanoculleus sp. CWC-02]